MSNTLRLVSAELQWVALASMAIVFIFRLCWLWREAGRKRRTPSGGILTCWANLASPEALEGTRGGTFLYAQFVLFHLAIAASILMSFLIPYAPGLIRPPFIFRSLQVLFAVGCIIGWYRLYRRLCDPVIYMKSNRADFFSIFLITIWLFVSIWAAPNRPDQVEGPLLSYFVLTAFFIGYVSCSKIFYYLYDLTDRMVGLALALIGQKRRTKWVLLS